MILEAGGQLRGCTESGNIASQIGGPSLRPGLSSGLILKSGLASALQIPGPAVLVGAFQ